MNVAAGAGSHCAQKVAGHDHVGGSAADPVGGLGGDAAGAVEAQAAADTLESEAAFHGLSLHPVVGRLHG